MPTLTIDGTEITVENGLTVMQACEQAGVEIPRFCYHDRLSIAGNCRMCLVEIERSPKPVASCAMPAADGMVVLTNSESVKKAREGVMEFLLINHPLDCPICDQGGECDLQDQAMAYGRGSNRFAENKRAVRDKNLGPLVKTIMTRCIHCTRCIRFASEIAGVPELGAIGRGEHMEITTYVEGALTSELSGNLIDLCPVGALTSKPYAFSARSWELTKTESIDVHDAVGSSIRVDSRGQAVMRVLPRPHEDLNEEWISDKTRFAVDGLARQRLDRAYVRDQGKLRAATWSEAFARIADRVRGVEGSRIAALAGDLADAESIYALKGLMGSLGSANLDCRLDGAALDPRVRASYLFNTTIAGIENADACLLVGTNPRWEAPLINARLRKRYLMGGFPVGVIGPAVDLTYRTESLGAGPETLAGILAGNHSFARTLEAADRPMIVLGQGALTRPDGAAVLATGRAVAEKFGMVRNGWNGFNVLQTAAARVGAMDIGFVPGAGGRGTDEIIAGAGEGAIEILYLLGADEIAMDDLGSAFVIYQGHHGDAGAHRADVILPGAAYTEKGGTYVSTEGRAQRTARAVFPPGDAREDWAVIRALSESIGHTLPFESKAELRAAMIEAAPGLATLDAVTESAWGEFGTPGDTAADPFVLPTEDFYLTNSICRASEIMAECSALYVRDAARTGTDG